jgi:5,6-dimethylbenzimidazole synthase
MDVWQAMQERRSCRSFRPDPVDPKTVERILEAGTWAPSPLNMQPWQFVVVTSSEVRESVFQEAERCRAWAREESGWEWLDKYQVDFLRQAPVLVVVIGDPRKTGVDQFQQEGNVAYQHACAAAIQNMLLAAHALGLGGLWFTFFDRTNLRGILDVEKERMPVGIVCLGHPDKAPRPIPRKAASEKTRNIG